MALQTTGPISLSDIAAEFGGSPPHKLSEYYRGGPFVPSSTTVSTITREPSTGGKYVNGGSDFTVWNARDTYLQIEWNGTNILFDYNADGGDFQTRTSHTDGSWTYYKGSFVEGGSHEIYRKTESTSTQSINTSVPSSGNIRSSQLYGARAE